MSSFEKELYSRFCLQKEYLGENKVVNNIDPLVSISVPTYQHKNYIKQCLDSILSQIVSFPIEIIIGEDGSIDGTADICKHYAEEHTDRIRLFLRDRSLSQYIYEDGRISRFNGHWNRMSVRGKYIAICEGDDYWTDPLKLQKQVNFLEANPDYSMCFHNAIEHWQDERKDDKLFSNIDDKDYDAVGLTQYWIVPTASLVYRRNVITSPLFEDVIRQNFMFGDTPLILTCAALGKVRGMSDVMSVYRRHSEGVSQSFNIQKYHAMVDYQVSLRDFFHESLESISNNGAVNTCMDGFSHSVRLGHPDFRFIIKALKIDPDYFFKTCLRRFWNFLSGGKYQGPFL